MTEVRSAKTRKPEKPSAESSCCQFVSAASRGNRHTAAALKLQRRQCESHPLHRPLLEQIAPRLFTQRSGSLFHIDRLVGAIDPVLRVVPPMGHRLQGSFVDLNRNRHVIRHGGRHCGCDDVGKNEA